MPMGLNILPSTWQSYINAILDCLQSRKYCEAIMDDLLLFTPSKETHMNKLEDLLKALLKNGLKISPKKCQLFKTSLQYMANEIFIKNKKVCCLNFSFCYIIDLERFSETELNYNSLVDKLLQPNMAASSECNI